MPVAPSVPQASVFSLCNVVWRLGPHYGLGPCRQPHPLSWVTPDCRRARSAPLLGHSLDGTAAHFLPISPPGPRGAGSERQVWQGRDGGTRSRGPSTDGWEPHGGTGTAVSIQLGYIRPYSAAVCTVPNLPSVSWTLPPLPGDPGHVAQPLRSRVFSPARESLPDLMASG